MFTGIIQAVGRIARLEPRGGDVRLVVDTAALDMADVALGDSIAVSGVCLTVIAFDAGSFAADVSNETLAHTTLGKHKAGDPVNLEKALRLADELLVYIAPIMLGNTARPMLTLPPLDDMASRWNLRTIDRRQVGDDMRLQLRPVIGSAPHA